MGQTLSNNPTQDEGNEPGEGMSAVSGSNENERVEQLIEELKLRSAELEEANRELRRVSHYRSLFLARMSHELRTPLTSILGFSEILLDQEELTEAQRRFCKKIQDSGFQLQTSLNQLVDLSRLEAGQTEVFLQEFLLRETLRESCAALARPAQMQRVSLEYDLAPDVTTVVSDQGKLRQILYNFMGWSLSRSSPGQTVSVYADLIDTTLLRLQIDDFGEHVADLSRVFDPEETTATHEANINELGIIIGHRLIYKMNGNITLQNRDAGGLRVLIQLPARPAKG
ncbi:MAG: sensor histidine kinase [Pyrinomonadaceae bacterium]